MKSVTPPLGFDVVTDPVVRSAVLALNGRDSERWFELFSEKPEFTDDGVPRDLVKWCEEEFFGRWRAYIISVERVEDGGLTLRARYHSDKWGDFKTFWRFKVASGRISRLDVGAGEYR